MKKFAILAFVGALASCGESSTEPPEEPAATAAPTSYFVRKVDMFREVPNDICRTKNPDFIRDLVARVIRSMPPELQGDAQFEDFSAHGAFDGKGMEATMRFSFGDGSERIFLVGPFEPANCHVGELEARAGADQGIRDTKVLFKVPE